MYLIYSVKSHNHEGIWNENRHVKMLTKKSPRYSHPFTPLKNIQVSMWDLQSGCNWGVRDQK